MTSPEQPYATAPAPHWPYASPPGSPPYVPRPPRRQRQLPGIETRQILLTLGAICLIVAFTAGTALVWATLRPGGQAALMAAITIALLAGAATARRLPATAEALAAVGLAGCVVDVISARTLHLSFAVGVPAHWYVATAALVVAGAAAILGKAAPRLISAPLVWSTAPLVAAVAAVNPTNQFRSALLTPIGIAVAAALDNALRRAPSPNIAARIVNVVGGTSVATAGYFIALHAAAHQDPIGVWGAALPLAVFAFPVLAGHARWVADDLSASVAGVAAATLVMAYGFGAGANARTALGIVLPILAAYVLVLDGGAWTRRTQIAVTPLAIPGAFAWKSLIAVDARFAAIDYVLAGAALGLALVWPKSRSDAEAVRAVALCFTTALATTASTITLHLHGVTTVEAYLATPAALLIAIAAAALVRNRKLSSVVLAPGLAIALVPTLLMALGSDHQRQAILIVAATVIVCIGAELRLGVPLVMGSGILGLLALRLAGPQLAMLPKWEIFAAAGAVLLTLGATWDARLDDARRFKRTVTPRIEALR